MKKAILSVCLLAGLALASVKSYTVTFLVPTTIGGTQLQAGDYKVEVQDQKIVIKHGRQTTEAGVKVETENPSIKQPRFAMTWQMGRTRCPRSRSAART